MYIGYIYRHWIINDKDIEKSYIGQTIENKPERRWGKNGKGYKPQKDNESTKFYNAIKKHGWNNFIHEILLVIECETPEELCFWLDEWEKYYIEKYDSFRNGYNSTTGGSNGIRSEETKQKQSDSMKKWYDNGGINPNYGKTLTQDERDRISKTFKNKYAKGEIINPRLGVACEEETKRKISEAHKGKTLTEETKQKISETMTGEGNPMYGYVWSEEQLQQKSDSMKEYYETEQGKQQLERQSERMKGKFAGEKNPMYGVHRYGKDSPHYGHKHTEEYKKQQSERMKGKYTGEKNPKARAVICLETLEVFTTVKEAKKWCGSGAIGAQIKGQRKSAGKHPITGEKLHWQYYDEYLKQVA